MVTPTPRRDLHSNDGGRPLDVRRAVFFDVENSSRLDHMTAMIDYLGLTALEPKTQIFAVGNWRVVGPETARLLGRHGAQLIHSAPAFGVKDWSDLRIAAAAGLWLGGARAADTLEIVSDDQAFDAVGDVAASYGVIFRRLSFRTLARVGELSLPQAAPRPRRHRLRRQIGHGSAGARG